MNKHSILFIITALYASITAAPFEEHYNGVGQPLLIYVNPALLSYQKSHNFGIGGLVSLPSKIPTLMCLQGAYTFVKGKSAFALGFKGFGSNNEDQVSFAFSHRPWFFSWGGALHLVLKPQRPELSCDLATSVKFLENSRFNIILKNLYTTDSIAHQYYRELLFNISGGMGTISLFNYNLDAGLRLYDVKTFATGIKLHGAAELIFFDNPRISVMAGGSMVYNSDNTYDYSIDIATGIAFAAFGSLAGLWGGGQVGQVKQKATFMVYYNPLQTQDNDNPQISLHIKSSIDYGIPSISIALTAQDNGVGLDQWILVIAPKPGRTDILTRSFSGGQTPPSTILWDTRDSHGTLVDGGVYYARFIVYDKNKNVAMSDWTSFVVLQE